MKKRLVDGYDREIQEDALCIDRQQTEIDRLKDLCKRNNIDV